MRKLRWFIPLAALGGLLVYSRVRREPTKGLATNMDEFSGPATWFYEIFAGLIGSFYDKVAYDVASRCSGGTVLDAGSGTGNLAVHLAKMSPQLEVFGVDISPDMVERARGRAVRSHVSDRVRFTAGDVGQLPFTDGYFDMVMSTLSMHHWPDPERGLAEIFRVLKPGGQACIYDLSDRVLQSLHHSRAMQLHSKTFMSAESEQALRTLHSSRGLERAVESSPFRDRSIDVFRWPWSLPVMRRMCLRRNDAL